MASTTLLAQQGGYLVAGVLTVLAAATVTLVILITSRSNHDIG